jgi:glutamyl-tRNA(Gln) amidotransferase subunit E
MKNRFIDPKQADWSALGLRCGVEIHQQLYTEKKLFCRCPAGYYTSRYDARVIRHMRPTLSELGEYDGTALMEFKTKKNITYLLDRRSVCTYELDDTPPFEINLDAVDIVLEICMALGCKIVGEIHVIRKQYLDGSIPTGFQRTAIIGVDGSIPYKDRSIGIIQVSVEEDSCREVSDDGHQIVFRTDRLSMPLIEVVTEPQMYTPEEAAEVVRLLGRVMRSTGRVRRGAGASRQDVNVSVEGGTRVEIKGVPSISLIPELVAGEGVRQRALLDICAQLKNSKKTVEKVSGQPIDVADIFENTKTEVLQNAAENHCTIKAMRIRGMREVIEMQVGVRRTIADELAGRVRVIACLDQAPIIIHCGNYANFDVSEEEWKSVQEKVGSEAHDAIVLLWGPPNDVELGMVEILDRLRELWDGVPNETRQVIPDGMTDFERILPGPDRMYPDTDSPPLAVPEEWLDKVKEKINEPVWECEKRLNQDRLPADAIDLLAISPRIKLYDSIVKKGGEKRSTGIALSQKWTALEREGVALDKLSSKLVEELFGAANSGRITMKGVELLLEDAAETPELGAGELIEKRGFRSWSDTELKDAVKTVLDGVSAPKTTETEAQVRYYMGEVMPQFIGSALGSKVCEIVTKVHGE